MIKFMKRLFCPHIYETVEIKDLNRTEVNTEYYCGLINIERYKFVAIKYKCVKCDNISIVERKASIETPINEKQNEK